MIKRFVEVERGLLRVDLDHRGCVEVGVKMSQPQPTLTSNIGVLTSTSKSSLNFEVSWGENVVIAQLNLSCRIEILSSVCWVCLALRCLRSLYASTRKLSSKPLFLCTNKFALEPCGWGI